MTELLLQALRILVVDDDQDSRDMMTVALEGEGAIVLSVDSIQAAETAIEQWRPDILISDIRMPDGNGYELIRSVRSKSKALTQTLDPLPAIALTAFAGVEERQASLSAGFQQHLTKPVDLTELYSAIAVLVKRPPV